MIPKQLISMLSLALHRDTGEEEAINSFRFARKKQKAEGVDLSSLISEIAETDSEEREIQIRMFNRARDVFTRNLQNGRSVLDLESEINSLRKENAKLKDALEKAKSLTEIAQEPVKTQRKSNLHQKKATPPVVETLPPVAEAANAISSSVFELIAKRLKCNAVISPASKHAKKEEVAIIKAGSLAVVQITRSFQVSNNFKNQRIIRQKLIEDGILVKKDDEFYEFSRDHQFASPNEAAQIVTASGMDAGKVWRSVDDKRLLREWREQA